MNNGPRILDLADQIEAGLYAAGLDLTAPICRIGSDGEFCGLGEQHAAEGLFRGVDHAYYLGGGTGLAEALKLRGALLGFDRARAWIARAWEIRSAHGLTFEQLVSAAAINQQYALRRTDGSRALTVSADELRERVGSPYPEQRAAQGDPVAQQVLETAAEVLAELIFERIDTIFRGRRALDHRCRTQPHEPDYAGLVREHDYRGVLLQRVILGQRLGCLYDDPRITSVFRHKLDEYLAELIRADCDARLRHEYLSGPHLRPGSVVASRLSAAASLGAAVDAARRGSLSSQESRRVTRRPT